MPGRLYSQPFPPAPRWGPLTQRRTDRAEPSATKRSWVSGKRGGYSLCGTVYSNTRVSLLTVHGFVAETDSHLWPLLLSHTDSFSTPEDQAAGE